MLPKEAFTRKLLLQDSICLCTLAKQTKERDVCLQWDNTVRWWSIWRVNNCCTKGLFAWEYQHRKDFKF
jgi:hypothetical protein